MALIFCALIRWHLIAKGVPLMKTLLLVATSLLSAQAFAADTLTVYTYNSFTAEWGPGPKIKQAFE